MAEGQMRGGLNLVALIAAAASLASAGVSWHFSRQQLQQETLESDRGYQVQVYQHVREALQSDQPSPAQVNAACALVLTLPENSELKRRLAQILVEEAVRLTSATGIVHCSAIEELRETMANESVGDAGGASEVLAEAILAPSAAEESAPAAAESAAPAPAALPSPEPSMADRSVAPAPSRSIASAVVETPAIAAARQLRIANPVGWDIDVFYCSGAEAAANRTRAERAARALASAADSQAALAPGLKLGRVRLRELTEIANRRPGYRIAGDVVRAEAAERSEAEAIAAYIAGADAGEVTVDVSASRTPWYVSVFYCPARGA